MYVGDPVELREFQREAIFAIYDSPTRQILFSFGRKNAKTTFAGMLCLLHTCGPEARRNSQLISAAQSRDQAALLFNLMAKMARMNVDLESELVIRDTNKQLLCPALGTLYLAASADAKTNFGASPVFAVHDELGQVVGPRSLLYEAIETAMGAHQNPLSIVISTQAPTDNDLLSILIDDALEGDDPERKVRLWTAPEDDDPFDIETIRKANPALGDFLNEKEVLSTAEQARRMPSREAAYRNLILNQRINQNNPFIPRVVWQACAGEPDRAWLGRGRVYMGLDLSARNDLTALVYTVQDDDGIWHVWSEFFVPEIGIHDRASRDRVPYDLWQQQGFLTATAGASVRYETVADRLIDLCDKYDVAKIRFDRWRMDVLKAELERKGAELPLEPHGQGFKDMAPALDILESELMNTNVRHGGHPVLTWCAANSVTDVDPAGNRKLNKAKSTGRIDGMVAMAMALNMSLEEQGPQPVSGGLLVA